MYHNAEFVKSQIERLPDEMMVNMTNLVLKKIGKPHRKIRPNHPCVLVDCFDSVETVVQSMMNTDKYRTIDKYMFFHPKKVLNSTSSVYEAMTSVLGIDRLVMAMFKYPKIARSFGIELTDGDENVSV